MKRFLLGAFAAFIACFGLIENAAAYVRSYGYGYGYYRPPVVVYHPPYYVYGYHPVFFYGGGFFTLFIFVLVLWIIFGRR